MTNIFNVLLILNHVQVLFRDYPTTKKKNTPILRYKLYKINVYKQVMV